MQASFHYRYKRSTEWKQEPMEPVLCCVMMSYSSDSYVATNHAVHDLQTELWMWIKNLPLLV
jgi:hypothetical protein